MSVLHSFTAFHETYGGAKGAAAFPKRSRKLAFAKGMEERGVSNDKIREQTGWFRNPFFWQAITNIVPSKKN